MADDSGLAVDALGGAPGIYSARYAGGHDDEANNVKLLKELEGVSDRSAHYVCVITYKDKNQQFAVEGKTFGKITTERHGTNGFGYDCLFYSTALGKTFGDASAEEKDSVSHRSVALKKLKEKLNQ